MPVPQLAWIWFTVVNNCELYITIAKAACPCPDRGVPGIGVINDGLPLFSDLNNLVRRIYSLRHEAKAVSLVN